MSMEYVQYSYPEWPGIQSQKFKPGRLHIKPVDQIGRVIEGNELPHKGKKTFNIPYSKEWEVKPQIRIFQQKYQMNQEKEDPSKLKYIAPQRKGKLDVLENMGKTKTHSEQDRFHKRIGMMTLRQHNKYQEQKKQTELQQSLQTQQSYNKTNKMTWQDRELIEQAAEEKQTVMELDNWTDDKIYQPIPQKYLPAKSRHLSQNYQNTYNSNQGPIYQNQFYTKKQQQSGQNSFYQ
ncbi:hypothetical protein PPERSA_06932 [Pseudocohnilembus persalinus]|uniref:Uncharacterized protein n=1 Tax=Pseudocohnilembus persalinus TaxID=266149 RepID=A0A0V0QZJ8_PSEPJ|nr:hypothetical protein PPERSA_06932 [Pseudocohnilembus persalinus]|eukprot:KRX07317.1 hypothetical protein PPERSA_06932 [Pseudocohnilembus persalinus]